MLRVIRQAFSFGTRINTQVFHGLTNRQLATPELVKKLIIKPIHQHSRVSQKSLFHGKRVRHSIATCFSEKKHKVYKKVNKFKKAFFSKILGRKIFATVSSKAYRTIRQKGSFDNYILTTKPKDLDSKFGQYLRELMLRKINDSDYRVPYIIGTNRKLRKRKFKRYRYDKAMSMITIPKEYKQRFLTLQKKFGTIPEELNEEDYKKYLELQSLKRTLGKDMDPQHPLLLELRKKMTNEEGRENWQQKAQEISKKAEEDYLNYPRYKQYRKKRVETAKKENELMEVKMRELLIRAESEAQDDDNE